MVVTRHGTPSGADVVWCDRWWFWWPIVVVLCCGWENGRETNVVMYCNGIGGLVRSTTVAWHFGWSCFGLVWLLLWRFAVVVHIAEVYSTSPNVAPWLVLSGFGVVDGCWYGSGCCGRCVAQWPLFGVRWLSWRKVAVVT